MKEKEKKNYEVPMLTVVDFKTERGYAFSMSFKALSLGESATDDEFMEAERSGYGSANEGSWF